MKLRFLETVQDFMCNISKQTDQVKKDNMGWACSINGAKRNVHRVLVDIQKHHQEDLGVGGTVILRWILEK
jgi:uncharacterized protein (DUF927 family)